MSDAKQYLQWNKEFINALKGIRIEAGLAIEAPEKLREDEVPKTEKQGGFNNNKEVIVTIISNKRGDREFEETLEVLNVDLWATPTAESEGESRGKTR